MENEIRWGILGCGRIARKFAADLRLVPGARLAAIGSRSRTNAESFAAEFPVPHIHDSYESLASDPEVDVIYIASPHAQHHDHALLCLRNRKAVLCEKAFALNARQAEEMIQAARREKVFLMEALWTKFLPHYSVTMEMIRAGQLGQIRNVLVNFGFIPQQPVPQRIYDPALGGGSLLDIGIYCVFMALSVLGRPDAVEAVMTPASSGVDDQMAIHLKYADGAIAQLFSSFSTHLPTEAEISGTRGRIRLTSRFYEPGTTVEFYPERVDSRTLVPVQRTEGFGYQYEARHVCECLRMGLTESPVMRHEDSRLLMETLDRIRRAAGLHYPADN